MQTLYLSLGTNLGQREENLQRATQLIHHRLGQVVLQATPLTTKPVGFESANLFLNTALEVAVPDDVTPQQALEITQQLEREMGRTAKSRNGHYADRLIDIDLLLWLTPQGQPLLLKNDVLELPHPHLHERLFVLEPLAEIAPTLLHPLYGVTMSELLRRRRVCQILPLTPKLCTPSTARRLNLLLGQLTQSAPTHTEQSLLVLCHKAAAKTSTIYLLFNTENELQATATLCLCPLLTDLKAWVEDVVVNNEARGKGYAHWLLQHLTFEAKRQGADTLNLTSRPTRQAANHLYQSEGFALRETNVYKKKL